jgi:DNA-binding CsgD family transcriptional regulator
MKAVISSVVDAVPQWQARVASFRGEVRTALGEDGHPAASAERVALLLEDAEALRVELADERPADAEGAVVLSELLVELTETHRELRECVISRRFATLSRIHDALKQLRRLATPAELIDAAPRMLCESGNFERAMISRVRGSTWLPQAIYVTDEGDPELSAALNRYIDGLEIPLTTSLLETELVRRKAPALVRDPPNDPRTFHPLMVVSRSRAYVGAPIMPTGRAIGFLHADAYGSDRELTTVDRDNIFAFAEGFGVIFERAVLLERLDAQRAQVRDTFQSAVTLLDELCAAELALAQYEHEHVAVAETATKIFTARINALLTTREREVLTLMTEGATNRQIAKRLIIAEATVKSHVKHILRKLQVANRAEAISKGMELERESGMR